MSPTSHHPFAAATGWALFDWEPSANSRPNFTRIAGGMSATRLQLDRYRQYLQIVIPNSQIQFWVWSEESYSLFSWSNGTVTTFEPQVYPESVTVETAVVAREVRAEGRGPGGTFGIVWPSDLRNYTGRTQTPHQITIANRRFGIYSVTGAIQPAGSRVFVNSSGRVRLLAIGHA